MRVVWVGVVLVGVVEGQRCLWWQFYLRELSFVRVIRMGVAHVELDESCIFTVLLPIKIQRKNNKFKLIIVILVD